MKGFRARFFKPLLGLLALALFATVHRTQQGLNTSRERLGLTRLTPLENAPPVLAFTTVALGGFRGIIANALWIRATELQDDGKYFEMVQLADWISKLQPHFTTVWIQLAWNMSYNISVKFSEPSDRWLWVRRGIELLRDEGLKYNPQETLLYRELAWHFQHKIGANLDDANMYYKARWAEEMTEVFGHTRPNFPELLAPTTDDARARAKLLREKYKMDPQVMKDIDERYGPFEWRLPDAHAIYWAYLALQKAKREELITVRRVIYQSMVSAFQRGRLVESRVQNLIVGLAPNLDIIPHVNAAYEEMMAQDAEYRDHMKTGHRNFLRDASYFLYTHNRVAEANKWYAYLGEKYPDFRVIEGRDDSFPRTTTLDEYAVSRVQEDVGETNHDKTTANIGGLLTRSFMNLAIGEDDQSAGYVLLAQKIWTHYQKKLDAAKQKDRVGLDPFPKLRQQALDQLLDPTNGLTSVLAAQLRTKLGLAAGTNTPPAAPAP